MMYLFALLGAYGVTYVLTNLDGPFGIIYKMRNMRGMGALKCFGCTSVWVAPIIAATTAANLRQFFILFLGYTGGAILLNEFIKSKLVQ